MLHFYIHTYPSLSSISFTLRFLFLFHQIASFKPLFLLILNFCLKLDSHFVLSSPSTLFWFLFNSTQYSNSTLSLSLSLSFTFSFTFFLTFSFTISFTISFTLSFTLFFAFSSYWTLFYNFVNLKTIRKQLKSYS